MTLHQYSALLLLTRRLSAEFGHIGSEFGPDSFSLPTGTLDGASDFPEEPVPHRLLDIPACKWERRNHFSGARSAPETQPPYDRAHVKNGVRSCLYRS